MGCRWLVKIIKILYLLFNVFFNAIIIYTSIIGPAFALLYLYNRIGFLVTNLLALLNLVWLLGVGVLFLSVTEVNERGTTPDISRPETPPPSYAFLQSIGAISPHGSEMSRQRNTQRRAREESSH